jgi:ubiquinone/menaquinone biosynthesis C-methylase UbiE
MSDYIFGSSNRELLRLELQAELFEPETSRTLQLVGIRRGMQCIDFGCGNGYTAMLLSRLVGEEGKVIAIDSSKDAITAAEENVKKRNIKNIEFMLADVYNTDLKDECYDLTFSRFLFTHLEEPKRALDEMIRVLKPNGIVAAEDFNHEMRITYPYNEHLEKLRIYLIELLKKSGSTHDIAGMLYSMFKNAGLDANVNLYAVCFPMNEKYSIIPLLFAEVLKDRFLKYKIIDEDEYEEIVKGVEEYVKMNDAIVLYSSVFRVWGTKPAKYI